MKIQSIPLVKFVVKFWTFAGMLWTESLPWNVQCYQILNIVHNDILILIMNSRLYYITSNNNIPEKITWFWLAESSVTPMQITHHISGLLLAERQYDFSKQMISHKVMEKKLCGNFLK